MERITVIQILIGLLLFGVVLDIILGIYYQSSTGSEKK